MARPNPNPGRHEEALRSDERRGRSPEVEQVVEDFFGDDPDDERPGGGR